MILRDDIIHLLSKKIKELDCFLVDVKINSKKEIKILFDKEEGVVLEDCLTISRYIEEHLDRDVEDYKLDVCSPGIDNPFMVKEQYLKNICRDVRLITINGERLKGKLISFDEYIVIEVEKKNKKTKKLFQERISFPIEEIKETKLIIKFK